MVTAQVSYAFVVFYRFKVMSSEEAKKAKEFWINFSKNEWPEDITLVGDYRHAWGTDWNGFLFLETTNPEKFFAIWPRIRDKTRWFVENTRTIIGLRRNLEE
jgi:hypothetical protein